MEFQCLKQTNHTVDLLTGVVLSISVGLSVSTDASFPNRASIFFCLLSTLPGRLVTVAPGDLGGCGDSGCVVVSSSFPNRACCLLSTLPGRFVPVTDVTPGDLGGGGKFCCGGSSSVTLIVVSLFSLVEVFLSGTGDFDGGAGELVLESSCSVLVSA